MNNNVTTRVGVTLLIELINSSKQGNHVFKQLGISTKTMSDLSRMNVSELHALAETPFVQYEVNTRMLNISVQRIIDRRNRDDLISTALQKGASRSIMKVYGNITHKDFNKLRIELGLDNIRSRPQSLNDIEYKKLADLHNDYGTHNRFESKLDHLRCLVYLSDKTSMQINRIYEYFYEENQGIFLTEKYSGGIS